MHEAGWGGGWGGGLHFSLYNIEIRSTEAIFFKLVSTHGPIPSDLKVGEGSFWTGLDNRHQGPEEAACCLPTVCFPGTDVWTHRSHMIHVLFIRDVSLMW